MEHAIQSLFAGIAVAVLLYPFYRWLRDGIREMMHHDYIIRKARCGHDWPDVDKWDMSRVYRQL